MKSYDVPKARPGVLGSLALEGREEDTSKKRAATLRATLREIESAFDEVKAVRGKVRRRPNSPKVLSLAAQVIAANKVRGLGKHQKAALNEITSMMDDSSEGEEFITGYLKAMKSEYSRIRESLKALEAASVVEFDYLSDEAKQVLRQRDKQAEKLTFGNKDWRVSRAPVIPVSLIPLDIGVAKRNGLRVENIGGYALLDNQMVVGFKKIPKGKAREEAEKLAKELQVATGKALSIVGKNAVPYAGGIWYWLADAPTLNALRKAARGSLVIRDWGFGFSSEQP